MEGRKEEKGREGKAGRNWCWMMRIGSCAHVSRFLWRGGKRRKAGRERREGEEGGTGVG